MRPLPGSIVDYFSDDEIVAGVVLSDEKGRLRVVTERGREDRIAPGRVLAAYEGNPRLGAAPAKGESSRVEAAHALASAHSRAAKERSEALELALVWELLVDEGGERTLEEVTELATGERSSVATGAMLRGLLGERIHFVRRGELWEPRPRAAVEETLRQKAREKRRAEERARFLARARAAIAGERPFARTDEEEERRLLAALEELALAGSAGAESKEALTVIDELGVSGENPAEAAFRALHGLGLYSEDENLFIRRFGLSVDFPPGAGEAARRAVADALGVERSSIEPDSLDPGDSGGVAGSGGKGGADAGGGYAPPGAARAIHTGTVEPPNSAGEESGDRFPPVLPPRLAEEIARGARRDLMALACLSVDDEMTSEIDDALSIEDLGGGRARVGIHIADPGFFVAPGSELDRIAESRAVTFYLPERRVLMLPRIVSETASSLLPRLARPALSFFATLDRSGMLLAREIVPSVVLSRSRVTYEEADAVVAGAPTAPPFAVEPLAAIHRLALALEARRVETGAHLIRAPEIDIVVGADGTISLNRMEGDAPGRLLVSEMMILAGRIAAEFCIEAKVPCLYRRQAPPEEAFPPVLESRPYDPVAARRARRGLRRGETSLAPGRHYALGLDAYAQTTSPIRRYQDLVIHRQIKSALAGGPPCYDAQGLQRIAATTDEAERIARLAERGSDEYWTLKYLERKKGGEVEGVVVYREPRRVEVELSETLYSVSIPPRPDHELGLRLRFVIESVNPRAPSIRLRQLD